MYLVATLLCTQDMFQSEAVDIQYRSTKEHGTHSSQPSANIAACPTHTNPPGSGRGNGGTNL